MNKQKQKTKKRKTMRLLAMLMSLVIIFTNTAALPTTAFAAEETTQQTEMQSTDTSTDVSTDTSTDVSTGVPTDVSTDTSTDVPTDASTDVSTDVSTDASTDVSTDTSTDVSTDVSTDTSTDASTDTSTDTSIDTSIDTSTDVAIDEQIPEEVTAFLNAVAAMEIPEKLTEANAEAFMDQYDAVWEAFVVMESAVENYTDYLGVNEALNKMQLALSKQMEEPSDDSTGEESDGISTYGQTTGHSVDVRFAILYLDPSKTVYRTGYNFGPGYSGSFICQYSQSHAATAYISHTMSAADLRAARDKIQNDYGVKVSAWTKEAKANPNKYTNWNGEVGLFKSNTLYFVVEVEPVKKTYTVTYTDGVDGEEVFADDVHKDITEGSATPAFVGGTPTRKGYIFKGWKPAVAATVTADATYVAQWETELIKQPYTIIKTFVGIDRNQINENYYITYSIDGGKYGSGTLKKSQATETTNDGSPALQWDITPEVPKGDSTVRTPVVITEYNAEVEGYTYILDSSSSTTVNWTIAGNGKPHTVWLYNRYTADTKFVTLKYDANGKKASNMPNPISETKQISGNEKADFVISDAKPTAIGFTFKEWNDKSDGTGTKYETGDEISISEDTTLYAIWEEKVIIIPDSITITKTPVKTSYEVGDTLVWNVTVKYNSNSLSLGEATSKVINLSDSISEAKIYQVINGVKTEVTSITVTPGQTYNLIVEYVANEANANLVNTITATSGDVTDTAESNPVSVEEKTEDNYTVIWDDGFGNTIKQETIEGTEVSKDLYPEDPTHDGYKFTGWGEPEVNEETKTITITAKWEKEPEISDKPEAPNANILVNVFCTAKGMNAGYNNGGHSMAWKDTAIVGAVKKNDDGVYECTITSSKTAEQWVEKSSNYLKENCGLEIDHELDETKEYKLSVTVKYEDGKWSEPYMVVYMKEPAIQQEDPKETNYRVQWYEILNASSESTLSNLMVTLSVDENVKLIKEDSSRKAKIGEVVEVTEADKVIEGYTFDSENANNVLKAVVLEDGNTILKLYFVKNATPVKPEEPNKPAGSDENNKPGDSSGNNDSESNGNQSEPQEPEYQNLIIQNINTGNTSILGTDTVKAASTAEVTSSKDSSKSVPRTGVEEETVPYVLLALFFAIPVVLFLGVKKNKRTEKH